MWAKKYDKCVVCGTTEKPHKAKGMCTTCYSKHWALSAANRQMFTCLNCGRQFTPKWFCNEPRKFCCHECSEAYHTGKTRGKKRTKEEIIACMREAVLAEGRYLSKPKLLRAAHICDETYTKLAISRLEIYRDIDVGQPKSIEDVVYYILSEYIDDLEVNKVFDDCVYQKGKKLRFDLYSRKNNIALEIDGEHHWINTSRPELQYFQECDKAKESYAASKGIRFCRVRVPRRSKVTRELLTDALPEDIAKLLLSGQSAAKAVSEDTARFNDQSADVGSSDPKSGASIRNEDMV